MATGGLHPLRLDCPVCKKKMTQPTAFQCLHFFCQSCVDDMKPAKEDSINGYKCPICKMISPKDDSPAMDYLPQLLSEGGKASEKKLCDKCKTETATERCLDCKENFCKDCKDSHNGWSMLKIHAWEGLPYSEQSVIDQNVNCPDHRDKYITLHCKQCEHPICVVCVEKTHKDHPVEAIKNALEDVLPKIRKEKENVEKVIIKNEKSLSRTINHAEDLKKDYEEVEKLLEKKYNEILKKVRADYKIAQDKLVEIRGRQVDKVENFIEDLELRLTSARNIVGLTNATLQNTKDTSLLYTIRTKLRDRLKKSSEENLSEERVIMPTRATFTPKAAQESNSLGEVLDSYLSNAMGYNLKDLGTRLFTHVKTYQKYSRIRFAHVGDHLWDINRGSNEIHVLSQELEDLETKKLQNTGNILSLSQFVAMVLVAANNGLFRMEKNGDNLEQLIAGHFCAVSVKGDDIYALNNSSGKVHILKYDDKHNKFTQQSIFDIEDYAEHDWNTLHVTQKFIYLAEWESHNIRKYDHSGTWISNCGSQGNKVGNFDGPRICGSDAEDSLLIADCRNTRFQILTSEGDFSKLCIRGIKNPFHATIIEKNMVIATFDDEIQMYQFK